jgi:CubicO group peptidase (beta-lactamase class C family)
MEIADGKLPGAVVMVVRKGKIVFSDAVGLQDKGANTPMNFNPFVLTSKKTLPANTAKEAIETYRVGG